ncbi:hypothetical protein [Nocardia farcinica]|uniref:hypothetical protein n=1 Tax=Nocardia farcinica TaxID=37329 RepID=UPI0024551AAE|nr:hypothetical protein [Nocardia farcinica]
MSPVDDLQRYIHAMQHSHPASQPPATIVPTHLWDALEAQRPAWFTRLRDKGRVVVVRNTPPA